MEFIMMVVLKVCYFIHVHGAILWLAIAFYDFATVYLVIAIVL